MECGSASEIGVRSSVSRPTKPSPRKLPVGPLPSEEKEHAEEIILSQLSLQGGGT